MGLVGAQNWCLQSQIGKTGTNRVFGKPCLCPVSKRGRFDESGENDECAFYPLKTRASLLRPPKTTKMTKMAGVTQAKAWFRKSWVCSYKLKPEKIAKLLGEHGLLAFPGLFAWFGSISWQAESKCWQWIFGLLQLGGERKVRNSVGLSESQCLVLGPK